MMGKKGDSDDLCELMRDIHLVGNYKEELVRRCIRIMHPITGRNQIDFDEAAKRAVALGKRQFALEVLPSSLLRLVVDEHAQNTRKKWKWRWPWDAE